MGAISRETETTRVLRGRARVRGNEMDRGSARVCVHVCVHARVRATTHIGGGRACKKEGTGVGVCGEPEVQAGSRTAGASVRQRRHRFGLHAPIIGRLIGRYSATDSALHRFRGRPPSKSHAFSRECSAINGVSARALRREARASGKCIFRPAPRLGHPAPPFSSRGGKSSEKGRRFLFSKLERLDGPWIATDEKHARRFFPSRENKSAAGENFASRLLLPPPPPPRKPRLADKRNRSVAKRGSGLITHRVGGQERERSSPPLSGNNFNS